MRKTTAAISRIASDGSFRSVAAYTFSGFAGKAVSFLLVLLFTNPDFISPAENGLLSLFSQGLLFLLPFISLGMIHSTGASYFRIQRSEFNNVFVTGFFMSFVLTAVCAVVLYAFRQYWSVRFGLPESMWYFLPVITFLILFNEQFMNMARNEGNVRLFFTMSITRAALDLLLAVILVMIFLLRWEGRVLGLLITYGLVSIWALGYFLRKGFLSGRLKPGLILPELMFAIPVITLQLGTFALSASDRYFISFFSGENSQVGVYNIASTFGSIIIIACTAYLQYLFPEIYRILSSGDGSFRSVRSHFKKYVIVMTAFLAVMLITVPLVYHFIINELYLPGLRYFYFLAAGFWLWTISYFFFSWMIYFRMKKKILSLSVVYILVSVSANYIFVSRFGVNGAAYANISAYFIVLLITLFATRSWWRNSGRANTGLNEGSNL